MLSDLKVIELAGILAGPAAGLFFAEAGANVIKIENPATGGDPTRKWKLAGEDPQSDVSAYFNAVNWNKQHAFLNLENASHYTAFLEYVKNADVLICNWKKGDAEKLNVTFRQMQAVNPQLIYAQIVGFNAELDRTAFDIVLQAETGWLSMNGPDKNNLCKIPVAIIDLFAAHQLKEGILVALLQRMQTGKGAMVTVSLWDAAIASLANQAANYLNVQHIPQPMGLLHPNIAPYGECIITNDKKQIVLAVGTDKQFQALCNMLGLNDLTTAPMYANNTARVKHRDSLLHLLNASASRYSADEFLHQCLIHRVPAGIIRNLEQVFSLPQTENLVLEDAKGKRVRSLVYTISS
ncbi:MAG: CaiB/BaiF CoA transferase family protein [Chitinophagales bacterium]